MITEFTTVATNDWRQCSDYARVLEHLQRGEWTEASALLMYLLADYPDVVELQNMLADTQLRLETEQVQRGRKFNIVLPNRRIVFPVVLLIVLSTLVLVALKTYNVFITPTLLHAEASAQQKMVADQAQEALAAGDYDRALALYDQLGQLNPSYSGLQESRGQAQQAKDLAEAYDLAGAQLGAGNLADAQATLIGIQQILPTYRDVNVLLAKIERQQRINGLMREATAALEARNWPEVVARLEEVHNLTPTQDRSTVDADLFDAYLNLAQQLVDNSAGRPLEMQQALDVYIKALALRPQHTQAATARDLAQAYLNGYNALKSNNWEAAVQALEGLYATQPDYLGGEAARMLYNAYMRSGDDMLKERPALAWERYYRAGQLQGVDTTTARALAASLAGYVEPTRTPTPLPRSTPLPLQMRVSTPVADPASLPLASFMGKIAFMSNRTGKSELWVMDADGKNPFSLSNQSQALADYRKLREAETRSPDGQRSVFVTTPGNETNPQLFLALPDGASATRLTDLAGMNSDPVWSPTGHWIAFVSNQPGNDEIFLVGADGKNTKRLTNNTFEWDKHPSWSPNGAQLAYWSNQGSGHAQIWVMQEDGSGVTNISNNSYEERDPIWIK